MIVRVRSKEITFRLIPILLMLYSALIPLENVLAASFGGSINKYIGLLIMGLICMHCIYAGVSRVYIPKWMFLFSFFSFYTMFWSVNQNFQILSVMLNVVLFTLIVIQYPLTADEKRWIIIAIFVGGIVVSAMMLAGGTFTTINTIDRDRMSITIGGLTIDNNNLAVSLSICCLSGFSLIYKKKMNLVKKILMWLGVALIGVGILRTGSRGGLLALVVGGIIFLLFSDSGLRPRTIIIGAMCVFGGMYYIQNFMSVSLASRFTVAEVVSSGGTGRMDIWVSALRYYVSAPIGRVLFGYGFGSFPTLMRKAMGVAKASHNDVVQMLLETGIVGLVLYFKMWMEMAQHAMKKKNATALALLAVAAVGSLSMEMLIKKMLWLTFLIAILSALDDLEIVE